MSTRVRLGISPCPNDTFAFHALLAGEVDARGIDFDVELHDVEALNEGMARGAHDVAKVSFHAALANAERWLVLPAGAALGFGVGPLVLAASRSRASAAPPTVLHPGRHTTATLLWRLFHPEPAQLEERVFSEILPALEAGQADLGVCIHEARFVWRERGLHMVEDLGQTWERATGAPLPLGGLVARQDLEPSVLERVAATVRDSIAWGLAHREACLPTMRRHAQEQADHVLWSHVELYVNERTLDLGNEGRRALEALADLAARRGLLAGRRLAVLGT